MKRYIRSTTDVTDLKKKLSTALYEFIRYDLRGQKDYYKQLRKQFTVNGRKYSVKNDAKGILHVLTPEGDDIYGYAIPSSISYDDTDDIALDIINDAFNNDVDIYNKRVPLSVRVGNTSYGSNSGGVVSFGPYIDKLRKYYTHGNSEGRYAVVTIKAWWSSHDESCFFIDNLNEAISYAQQFIEEGATTPSGQSRDFGKTEYRYYADVIDTAEGKELFSDESESI